MASFRRKMDRGQALVEFALIIGVLLLIIFMVIEAGHILQANLTVQNAARAAGRYAITGQFDTGCLADTPPCDDPRVASIKAVAEEGLSGLNLNPTAGFEEAGFYLIEVFGTDATGNLLEDNPGVPGRPIIIRVSYRAPVITPLLRPIAETVMVTGQTVMNNEKVVQVGTAGDTDAPPVPGPVPTIGPTLPPPPDVAVSKSGPSSAVLGSNFDYTLSVVNNGPSTATNVQLSDMVPGELGVNSVDTDATGSCSGGSSVSCTWPSVASGETKTVGINVTLNSGALGDYITNTVSISLSESDPNLANNDDSVGTEIIADTVETDLAISKSGPESRPVSTADQSFYVDYVLTVRNNGPNEATGVVVTDDLPSDLLFNPGGSSAACNSGSPISCDLGTMASGAVRTLTIQARTPVNAPGTLTNTASVSAVSPADFVPGNNTDEHATDFVYLADLHITKTGSPSIVLAGNELTYQIEVWNEGPHDATGVSISDPLPGFVEFQSANYEAPDGDDDCNLSGNVVSCDIGGLAVGEGASATIVVVPQRAGTLVNSAQVSGVENDPDTINSATAVTMVDAVSDLSIVKTFEPQDETIFAGDLMTYTLSVSNDGPSRATGVTVVDDLPEEVVYQFVETDYGSCSWNVDLRRVTCWLGTVADGDMATIQITVIPSIPEDPPEEGWPIENRARVDGNEPDPVDNNNSAVTTTVFPGPPFIILQPACGPADTAVTIEGYRWSGNRDVTLTWIDEGGSIVQSAVIGSNTINNQTGRFTHASSVPSSAYKEEFEVRAEQPVQGQGNPPVVDIAIFRAPCPAPDLEVLSLSGSDSTVEQYVPVTYTVTITNSGNRVANQPFYVSLYAFDAPVVSTTTHLTATQRIDVSLVSSLNFGVGRTLTLRAESGFATTGTHYVYAFVDSDPGPTGAIVEMYETNNMAETTVNVTAGSGGPPPPPEGEQQLSGQTYVATSLGGDVEMQPLVRVSVYDAEGGTWLGTTYSDMVNAEYQFTNLPAPGGSGNYFVEATITVDGVLYAYANPVSPPTQTLILYPQ